MASKQVVMEFSKVIEGFNKLGASIMEAFKKVTEAFPGYSQGKIGVYATTGKGKIRYWWLHTGAYILCHVCQAKTIPVEEVWCGCKPVPRKMKKWVKKRREAYLRLEN